MLFTRSLFIGIDPSVAPNAIAYAALDRDLRPMALGQGDMDEVLAFLGGQHEAFVCLNGPPRPNTGVMRDPARRAQLSAVPAPGRWEDLRLADYELARRGLRPAKIPAEVERFKKWQRQAVQLHAHLEAMGYGVYPQEDRKLQAAEADPEVCYRLWLGHALFNKRRLEGRWQRQLVLYDLRLDLPNPMRFFEEVTRFKILQGQLPEEDLYAWTELQSLALAYAAWLAVNRKDDVQLVGEAAEGQVLVPVRDLKSRYDN